MIITDKQCNLEGTIVSAKKTNIVSSAFVSPLIKVQTQAPIEVEILVPKPQITTLVAQLPTFDTKIVPWNYSINAKGKGKEKLVVKTAATRMIRFGHCYALKEVVQGGPTEENNQKRVVMEAKIEDFWRK